MGFLIFSCARTILLAAVYMGFHFALKHLHNMLHTVRAVTPGPHSSLPSRTASLIQFAPQVFLIVSTILWIISGVLIHQMWGYVECANEGVADDFGEFKSQIMGGLSECHEIKIIEILAWAIAAVSILATIPVVMTAMKRKKAEHGRTTRSGANHAV